MALWHPLARHLQEILDTSDSPWSESLDIPIQCIYRNQNFYYQSSLAFLLSQVRKQSPLELAHQIATELQPVLLPVWNVKVMSPGLLQFTLTDLGIVTALELLLTLEVNVGCRLTPEVIPDTSTLNLSQLITSIKNHPPAPVFSAQYSHARCCSLLRLAHRDQIITLTEPEPLFSPPTWSFLTPDPMPWLTASGNFRCQHSAERDLLSQLLITFDAWSDPLSKHLPPWQKIAINLSDAFQEFYRHCRIWGEVKNEVPELASTRLGLVLVTQKMLGIILTEKLGVFAPLEL